MMRDLGKESETFGHWKHCFTGTLVGQIPESILAPGSLKANIALYEKVKAREAKLAKQ